MEGQRPKSGWFRPKVDKGVRILSFALIVDLRKGNACFSPKARDPPLLTGSRKETTNLGALVLESRQQSYPIVQNETGVFPHLFLLGIAH